MVLAFSLQSDIKSIGAYAGFAAIIGLALLVLLYFAQARELRRISDRFEEQEDRLRAMPTAAPMPRPAATAPPRPAGPQPQTPAAIAEPGAATTATVAVPGARRVSVGAVAAANSPAAEGERPAEPISGAVAAATVAGALMASGAAAKPSGGQENPVDALASERPPATPAGDAESGGPDVGGTPGAGPARPSAAVPLSARPAATAEPVGAAQAFGLGGASGASDPQASPDTAENAVVAPFDAGPGVVAVAPDADAAGSLDHGSALATAVSPEPSADPFDPAAEAEISAERIAAAPFDFAAAAPPAPVDAPEFAPGTRDQDEPPPLGPSTAAGGRPRFPPGPDDVRAAPVAAAVTTRRGGRDRPAPDLDEDERPERGGVSVLRLLAAAIVIVAVLIFIATKVFGTSSPSSPSSANSNTTPGQSAVGPPPSSVVVAVLNGTHSAGLAATAAKALENLGFKRGAVGNALSHGHHATLVSYTAGNRAAAAEVAKDLATTPAPRVGPLDPRTAALLATQSATTPAVVVTLGSDYLPK